MFNIFKLFGILGLILIIIGVLLKKREKEDMFYIASGLSLEVYSISIKDPIFITLQAVFILAAVYDLVRRRKK
tara:strand:+ start:697 stop:915 length:219 start_codon:yes stop_codon:yes gene_type:complete